MKAYWDNGELWIENKDKVNGFQRIILTDRQVVNLLKVINKGG